VSAVASPAAPAIYPLLFDGQSTDEVRENREAAGWLLADVRANPSAYHPALQGVLAEVVEAADLTLANRPAVTVDQSIGADLDEIKSRVDIAGYIARRAPSVRYRRGSGGHLRARCPWPQHEDDEPSFSVNPDKGYFNCFGCGRKGDLFTFVMLWDGYSFKEAIVELAREAGVDLPTGSGAPRPRAWTVRVG